MPANKIGSYIVHYRSRKREEAEQERQRRIEDAKRAPKIIDPSFELFGYASPQEHLYEETTTHNTTAPLATSPNDDWVFQNRRASTVPTPYQFEPYCQITPKTSTSSSVSASSSVAKPVTEYDMGWDTASTARPRPQSYLPSSASANYSMSMSDLHKDSTRSRRQTTYQEGSSMAMDTQPAQSGYKVGASLTRPFSIDDPLELLSEPVSESHLYNQASSLPPYDAISRSGRSMPTANLPGHRDYRR